MKPKTMADYADDYKDYETDKFIADWCPEWAKGESKRIRYNLARGHQAMTELQGIRYFVREFNKLINR